jgi:toxin ParE1/3/4
VTLAIQWRASARAGLRAIVQYISDRDPAAARKLRDAILDAVATSAEHPYLYRNGRVPGTRELVAHPNYIVLYLVGDHI